MPGYETHIRTLRLGGHDYRIRSLVDLQQFADPDHHAQRLGISSAQWSLFGHVWPAGRLLAEAMATHDIAGKRILELGCGLGLASLVLRHRGADIVASDYHPLAETFLAYNSALNGLPAVPYRTLRWGTPNDSLGRFDLVIGSDILYERDHAQRLSALMHEHAHPVAEVMFTDPGRGNSAPFTRALAAQGYAVSEIRCRMDERDVAPFRGRLLHYSRAGAAVATVTAGATR
ncbi:MAG TPA: methyltransferase domain-containing protein [Luteimonas sp.]|nr:methyltransferase domain-containing protein [Luteimonas sp.]